MIWIILLLLQDPVINFKPVETPDIPEYREMTRTHRSGVSQIEEELIVESCGYWDTEIDGMTESIGERNWLKRVMKCESMCRSWAKNSTSEASGLMQFMPSTFHGNSGVNIWDGREQLEVALRMYRNGQAWQWSCK